MFPYTEKYTESEHAIQNNNLLYKIDHKCPNTFNILEKKKWKYQKSSFYFVIYIYIYIYKLHNLYFVIFVYFGSFVYFVSFCLRWGFEPNDEQIIGNGLKIKLTCVGVISKRQNGPQELPLHDPMNRQHTHL